MKLSKYYLLIIAFAVLSVSSYAQSKFVLGYSGGQYAPVGMSIGSISNKGGFLLNARFASSVFNEVSIYSMTTSGGIDDDFWDWNYTGNSEYRRGSVTLNYISKWSGDITGTSLHGYFGLGYGFATYMYEYEQYGSSGTSYGTEWIKWDDMSKSSLEAEAGLLIDFGGFNVSVGYSTLEFEENMLTFGAGFSF